jgi:gliding motility-associated-like protein
MMCISKTCRLITAILCLIFHSYHQAQIQLAFQGGEPGNNWNFTSSGADATAQAQAFLLDNIVSGSQSLVVGGNTPGGSCIDGGSGNGPSVARFFTFDPVDIASSSNFYRTLKFNWGSRHPVCVGAGWDTGENLVFTAYYDGVAQPSVTLAVGNNNANFSIQDHIYEHTIPPCVNSFYFHLTITTNRRDELLFIDNVTLSTPQLNSGGGQSTQVNLTICQSELPYNWNGLIFNQAGTQTQILTNSFGCDSVVHYNLTVNEPINPLFNQVDAFCSGANIPALPTTSQNNIIGTWSPALNNTASTTYTFTPNADQCATTATMTIIINPNTTPIFAQLGPFCSGEIIPALPSTSQNNITGTWSPALNNTATTTYTFTPNAGQCATTTTMTITINPNITPTFAQVGPFCSGETIPALPNTSLNNISGSWTPVLNNTATTTYTFTPSAGQCAVNTTLQIEIIPNVVPQFNSPGAHCVNSAIPDLPETSLNNIQGTWSPPINNTQTTTYTFTPQLGVCAVPVSLTIPVDSAFIPEFNIVQNYCSNANIPNLPNISTNGIQGTWSPVLNNTSTTTYTFTPLPNQCSVPIQLTINIVPNEIPTFNILLEYCSGDSIPQLPTTSTNNITGTWFPALNNQQTTTYTFTPDSNQCAFSTSLTLTITPSIVPIFPELDPYCAGAPVPDLPTTSLNGVHGTWFPAINNLQTSSYLFTPSADQNCAQSVYKTVEIIPVDSTFYNITICEGQLPFNWFGQNYSSAGTYFATTPNSSGCEDLYILNLTVVDNPVLNLNISVCMDDFPITYLGQNITGPGLYSWISSSMVGCDTSYVLTVNSLEPPAVFLNQAPLKSCKESIDALFTFTSPTPISSCLWEINGQSGTNCAGFSAIFNSAEGCYDLTLEVTDLNGCSSTIQQTDMVCIYPNPIASFSLGNSYVDAESGVQIFNNSQGADTFIWNFGDGSTMNTMHPQHSYNTTGTYEITLTAINEYGCSDTFHAQVDVGEPILVYVPNTFTPGGGNLNEVFLPIITSGVDRYNYVLLIFNRWGEVMFESRNPDIGWDGSYGGRLCPSGTFIWQIEFQDTRGIKRLMRGYLNLLR